MTGNQSIAVDLHIRELVLVEAVESPLETSRGAGTDYFFLLDAKIAVKSGFGTDCG
jgi:hypothetical protein